ncbi:hypothetical protein V6N13_113554 [Hibiscus sabdariffa]
MKPVTQKCNRCFDSSVAVLLEIPDYPDDEVFYAFCDGLQNWAKLEIEGRCAQDLASVITIAKSLTEFKKSENSK